MREVHAMAAIPLQLSASAQQALLDLAYRTLTEYMRMQELPSPDLLPPGEVGVALQQPGGAFVTLSRQGELRGCIGHIDADKPLWQVVQQMALAAALDDPRFMPLQADELDDLEIEISVLSPLIPLDPAQVQHIQPGVHGLLISKHGRRGLLLPQVATEHGWGRERFLDAVCEKAGLPPGSWRHGAALQAFTAQVFGSRHGARSDTPAGNS
jgi:AmmeMemoRadiSam system protein A